MTVVDGAIGITWGDPWAATTYSGVPYHCFAELEARGLLSGRADARQQRLSDAARGLLDLRLSLRRGRPTRSAVWRYLPENIERLTARFRAVEAALPGHGAALQFGVAGLPEPDVRLVAHVEIPLATAVAEPVFATSYGFAHLSDRTVARALEGERWFLSECDVIWTNTPFTARCLADAGANRDRIVAQPPGCGVGDPGPITRSHDGCKLLFVGKDWIGKGGPLLLKAFDIVRRRVPDARLTVVGCNPDVGGRSGVDVLGFLDVGDPAQAARLDHEWRSATLFCLPSYWESTGVAYMEAMLYGLPVVMLRGQGRDEVFPDDIAIHLDDPDPDALAEVVVRMQENPDDADRRGKAGRDLVLDHLRWSEVGRAVGTMLSGGAFD